MSIRGALVLFVVAACLTGLGGCSSSSQLSDLWSSKPSAPPGTPSAILGDKGDTTGSVSTATQPAEPGPSGEPVAPLATPGLSGDDPSDDLQQGKRYFRANNFGLAENSFRTAVEKHPRDAEAWVDLAASYDRLHRFDLADRAYAEAIRLIGPTAADSQRPGVLLHAARRLRARARRSSQQAQAKDPANPYVRANLQLLERAYRDGKAIQ